MKLSIVAPIYNEEANVAELHRRILDVIQTYRYDAEIIFVNDGSTDRSLSVMKQLTPLTIVNLRKNFGQTAAMDAGFKEARGDYVVTIDGDLQNDPADIPRLILYCQEHNLDVVSGWRKTRRDPLLKRFFSRGAYVLRHLMINDGIHDSGCSLKIYRRAILEHLDLYGEMHRFIPAILKMKGYRIGELEVSHHPRANGVSKYGFARTFKGLLDMGSLWFWKKYAARPLHLFGGIGVFLFIVSALSGGRAVYEKIFLGQDLSDTFLTELSMFGFLIGIQFLVFGLLADILSKIYFSATKDVPYSVAEIIRNSAGSTDRS